MAREGVETPGAAEEAIAAPGEAVRPEEGAVEGEGAEGEEGVVGEGGEGGAEGAAGVEKRDVDVGLERRFLSL